MDQTPRQLYQANIEKYKGQLAIAKKNLLQSSILRFLVFSGLLFWNYYFFGNASFMIGGTLIIVIGFLFLLVRHQKLSDYKETIFRLLARNQMELAYLDGDFSSFANGDSFRDAGHYFSNDIDLFGERSFFQSLNRTATSEGEIVLASMFLSNDIEHIKQKQDTIEDLKDKVSWRQEFAAAAQTIQTNTTNAKILERIQEHESFTKSWFSFLPIVFTIVSALIFVGSFTGLLPISFVGYWYALGFLILGTQLKKITKLAATLDVCKKTFSQYHKLLAQIEETDFSSQILKEFQKDISTKKQKASHIFKRFSTLLDGFDQRSNLLYLIFILPFTLRDLSLAFAVEKWIATNASTVAHWFDTVAKVDAYNSLANYAFNNAVDHQYPELSTAQRSIDAIALGHPLLARDKRVSNDFNMDSGAFLIVTGANMAGKSTFLRTISLSIMMANVGLPVCAQRFIYAPIKLISSMRSSDSLADDSSYFFSELTRLKYIVETLKKDRYFVILDEILKGTNSKDKAEGSQKFVEKLVSTHSTGLIATHDLSLCTLAESYDSIDNYYFDAQIIADELHFDYTFKKGICQNMNASFLLRKMDIV